MYYLIADAKIVQTADTPFEVHENLIWIEAEVAPDGHVARYENDQIVFDQTISITSNAPSMKMKTVPCRDFVFCFGEMNSNTVYNNPNTPNGFYNQFVFLLEGSGYAVNKTTNEQIKIEEVKQLYDLSQFKDSAIGYHSNGMGAKWIAVNPMNDRNISVTAISASQTISDNANGITVLNAKGTVSVNGTNLDLNDPTFYHANTELQIEVAENSYALVVNYK